MGYQYGGCRQCKEGFELVDGQCSRISCVWRTHDVKEWHRASLSVSMYVLMKRIVTRTRTAIMVSSACPGGMGKSAESTSEGVGRGRILYIYLYCSFDDCSFSASGFL